MLRSLGFGEIENSAFVGCVGAHRRRRTTQACDAAKIDDAAFRLAGLQHLCDGASAHGDHALEIDRERVTPSYYVNLDDAPWLSGDSDLVDENIQASEFRDRRVDGVLTLLGYRDVGNAADSGTKPFGHDHRYRLLGPFPVEIHTNDRTTISGKRYIAAALPLPIPSPTQPAPVAIATLPWTDRLSRTTIGGADMLAGWLKDGVSPRGDCKKL